MHPKVISSYARKGRLFWAICEISWSYGDKRLRLFQSVSYLSLQGDRSGSRSPLSAQGEEIVRYRESALVALVLATVCMFVITATAPIPRAYAGHPGPPPYTGQATLTYPLSGATGVETNPTLRWDAPTGANYFKVIVTAGSSSTYYTTASSLPLTLSPSTTYYWQVASSQNGGATYGPSTATWNFKTGNVGIATLTYPARYAVSIPTNPTLTWKGSSDANYYKIIVTSAATAYYYSPTPQKVVSLSPLTNYWWQVQASSDSGATYGPLTPTWTFQTGSGPFSRVPMVLYPANGATGVPMNPTLTWTAPSDANYYKLTFTSGTTTYYYLSTASQTLSLTAGTDYWWQVQASSDLGASYGPQTQTVHFTIWSYATAILNYPTDVSTGIPTNPTLNWTGPSGANYYKIIVNPGSSPVTYYSATQSKTVSLNAGTTYWWQVLSSPDGGVTYGPGCHSWSFTTWKAPTTDWSTSKNTLRGQVFDRAQASNGYLVGLSGIPITVEYTYNSYHYKNTATTRSDGYFSVGLTYTRSVPYTVYVGWGDSDGYWTEKRTMTLPATGQFYGLMKDGHGDFFPFQSYSHTPDCKIQYLIGAQTTVTKSILPGELIGYTWTKTTAYGGGPGSPRAVGSIAYQLPYDKVTGIFTADAFTGPVTAIDAWPVGNPGTSSVDDYLEDPIVGFPGTVPALPGTYPGPYPGSVVVLSPLLGPGFDWTFYATTTKLDGWTTTLRIDIPGVTSVGVWSLQKTSGSTETITANVLNQNAMGSGIQTQYIALIQGPVIHVWNVADLNHPT